MTDHSVRTAAGVVKQEATFAALHSLPKLLLLVGLLCWLAVGQSCDAQGLSEKEALELSRMELPTKDYELLAVVGHSHILVGDILPKVDMRIASSVKGDISQVPPEELKVIRLKLLRMMLVQAVQTKMLGHAFVQSKVGTATAEQRKDAQQKIESQARKQFNEHEIPNMLEKFNVATILELDEQLRKEGTSLQVIEDEYKDMMLRQAFIQELIPKDPKVEPNEIYHYYNSHVKEFQVESKARWEQLTVLFANFESRQAAFDAIAGMGNEAHLGGNVQSVARERSQEPLAKKGGVHDWTSLGSLRSKPLEAEIFAIPLNELSRIIEDEEGFHIVRVLERREAGIRSLAEVQDEIREKLVKQKLDTARRELTERIRREVPVWSRYPDDFEGAKPLHASSILR